jgi:hypothetical protein
MEKKKKNVSRERKTMFRVSHFDNAHARRSDRRLRIRMQVWRCGSGREDKNNVIIADDDN